MNKRIFYTTTTNLNKKYFIKISRNKRGVYNKDGKNKNDYFLLRFHLHLQNSIF